MRRASRRTANPTIERNGAINVQMTVPVSKNDEVVVDIIGLTHEGEGVGRGDGFTLFIRGASRRARTRKVLKVKKQYGYAKLLESRRGEPGPCRRAVRDLQAMRRLPAAALEL